MNIVINTLTAAALFWVAGHALAQTAAPGKPPALEQIASPANKDTAWRPTATQMELALSRSRAYFEARDGGRFEAAYGFFAPSQKKTVSFEEWRKSVEAFNTQAGAAQGRTLRKVTWYKDAQGRPGTYAAVDTSSAFANLALHCGYVVWQEQPDGSFGLVREEENVIDKAAAAKMKPGQLEQIQTQFHC